MSESRHGRHRAAGRYNPAAELSSIVAGAATPLRKGSVVLAASGGLVAAIAVPAVAAPADESPATTTTVAVPTAKTPAPAEPAVAAPSASTPSAGERGFGALTVAAVEKPKGPPAWAVRALEERRAQRAAEEQAAREEAERQAEQERQEAASRAEEHTATTTDTTTTDTASTPEPTSQEPTPEQQATEESTTTQESTTPEPTSTPAATPSASGVIGIAKQYIGVPYVYGGSTPSGFDCSGFVQYVYAQAGKSLPRVTTAQQVATTPVSEPQPGDLVFFGSPAYHVGIYVGNGQMIDAPRTGSSVSIRPVFDGVSGYGRP